jgi:hypothetical protein
LSPDAADLVPIQDADVQRLQHLIIRRLAERYERLTEVRLNAKRQAHSARANVVATVPDEELEAALSDVRAGSGGELTMPPTGGQPNFCSVRSSCALAVSVFGAWRLRPCTLLLAGLGGFDKLRFEMQFPIVEDERRTPPNLDLVVWRPDRVVAVESKFVEQIAPTHTASFASIYAEAIAAAHPSWRARVALLRASPDEYRFFNAAQIVKHYLGLKADRPQLVGERKTILLYVYWEPADPETHRFFARHRAEVAHFADGLADEQIEFRSLSYRELWAQWRAAGGGERRRHVEALETRYLLDLNQ